MLIQNLKKDIFFKDFPKTKQMPQILLNFAESFSVIFWNSQGFDMIKCIGIS